MSPLPDNPTFPKKPDISVPIVPRRRDNEVSALVLSGGGAKGAFQVGVLKHLYTRMNFSPGIITGTSVGSLNAAKLAEGPPAFTALERLWRGITGNDSIYEPNPQIGVLAKQITHDIKEANDAVTRLILGNFLTPGLWNFVGIEDVYRHTPDFDEWLETFSQVESLRTYP